MATKHRVKKRYILGTIFIVVVTVLSLLLAYTLILASTSANPYEGALVTDGIVKTIASDTNYIYVGGSFTRISTYTGTFVVVDSGTAARNTAIPKTNGTITAIAPDGSGGWYIGGTFSKVGSTTINKLAHIDSSGSLDATWNPNPDGSISTIAASGSAVYVGGLFANIGGQARIRVAKLNNTNGNADVTWNPNADGTTSTILISGTDIYVGGSFTNIGGQARNYIAKLNNTTGAADATWNPSSNGPVSGIMVQGSEVYAIGSFTNIGGQARNYIAKLNNTTGAADVSWNCLSDGPVNGIASTGAGSFYVGGNFSNIGGQSRQRLAKLNNTNGNADVTFNASAVGTVNSIYFYGTSLYYAGYGGTNGELGKVDSTNGVLDGSWAPNPGNTVNFVTGSGSNVAFGGIFTSIGVVNRNNLARFLKTDMSLDQTWNPNPDNSVNTISVLGSDIYIGGTFLNVGAGGYRYASKLNNTTGAPDVTWNPRLPLGGSPAVFSIVATGSNVYIGGRFTTAGGQTRNNIALLNNTNADADALWDPNPNGYVYTILVSGSDVYVGGTFTNIGGLAKGYATKINNPNGLSDGSWDPNANAYVNALAFDGTYVYIGGGFTTIGGQSRNYVARVNNTNANADVAWNPNASGNVDTFSISGTDIYAGGAFTTIGGQTRNNVAKLNNVNGSADLTWDPNADSFVYAIYTSGSSIYIGGAFANISGQDRVGFVYYPPASSDATVTSGTYTVSAGGTSSETITNVPFATSKTTFLAAITKGNTYQSWNSSTITDPVTSNNTLVVTAEDGVTTVTYTITVNPDPNIAAVAADKAALVDNSIKGANPDLIHVSVALTNPLPSSGSNGSSITWVSSNPSVVSNNGQVVTRPAFGQMDVSVNMTATLTKGAVSDTKVFTLTVLASLSSAKAITAFNFSSPSVLGQINETNHTISLLVPYDTNLSSLPSVIRTTGSAVAPASGETHSYVTPYIYLVYAADSTTQEYTVTVTKVAANQTVPDVNGNATINNTTNQLVVTDPNQVVNLTVTDGTSNPTINYGNLTTIPETIVTSSTATINIPPSTTVTSGTPWDGVMNGPHDTVVTLPQISGYTGTLNYATELGFTLDKLTFDKGVRIIFKNGAGKRVGYSLSTEPLTEITTLCSEDSQAVGDALPAASDCKIDVGNDLILWTKHFTRFALFTETQNSSGSSNSGSGGGGGSPSAPTCDNPSPATPNITSIKYVKRGIISINWGAADKASSWTVAFGLKSGNYIYGLSDFGDNGSRSVNVSSLTPRTYYLSLRANNGCRPGDFSPEWQVNVGLFGITARLTPTSILNKRAVSTSINTPQITQIKYVAPGVINISWNQINGANSWTISYGLRSKKYIYGLADFGDSNSRSVNIGGLRNGTYYFVIRSNSNQPGNFSSEWRVTIYKGGVNASQVK